MCGIWREIGCDRSHGRVRRSQYRGVNPYRTTKKSKGLYADLGESLFNYNNKGTAEQILTTLKQIVKYTSTIYGQDIRNELNNMKVVSIEKPQHTQYVLDHHQYMMALRENIWICLKSAIESEVRLLIGTAATDADAAIALAQLQKTMEMEQAVLDKT